MKHTILFAGLTAFTAATLVYAAVDGPRATLMTQRDYHAAARLIEREARSTLIQCASLAGYEASVCGTQTRALQTVQMADLDVRYLGTVDAANKARVARIEAQHDVERARCDAFENDSRGTCRTIVLESRNAAIRELGGNPA